MAFISSFTAQLGGLLRSQTAARRIMLLGMMAVTMTALIWMALSAQKGSFAPLLTNLTPQDTAEARLKLAQFGIESRLDKGGATLMVPSRRADEAATLLAMEGIPSNSSVGFELMDKTSIGQSKFQQEKNYHRMREGELARTLLTLQEVERARVHLAQPQDSLFVKDEQQPTASVVLKLRRGKALTERQINGIVHLVSHSVEGLSPANVSIIDNEGNLLNNAPGDNAQQFTATQNSFKSSYEDQMKSRIETMLEKIVGKGRVAARVTADFDFSNKRQVSETYDPEGQVVRSEQSSMETKGGSTQGAGQGPTGSDSNLPGAAGTASTAAAQTSNSTGSGRNEATREYALSREWREVQSNSPTPQRISVALLVDGVYEETTKDGKTTQEYRPRTEEEITKLQDLVKAAIGFTSTETRQDMVTVECLPFEIQEQFEEKAPWLSYQMRQMIELGVTWGVVGLIGLLLIMFVLRPAVKHIMVSRLDDHPALLTSGTAGALAAANITGDETDSQMMEKLRAAGMDMSEDRLAELKALESQLGAKDKAFSQMLQMNQLHARSQTAQSQKIHKDMIDSAKSDPQRTVSLLRQWMEEA